MQAATAQAIDAPVHQRRSHKRFDYDAPCVVHRENKTFFASVRNISEGGINVRLEQLGAIPVGKAVSLEVSDYGPVEAVIRWSEGSVYGMQFLSPLSEHPQLFALVTSLSDADSS